MLWHVQSRLQPLFAADGHGACRRWSVDLVLERLKSLREERLLVEGVPVRKIRTAPDHEQAEILALLGVEWV